jgi:hypothetical protein
MQTNKNQEDEKTDEIMPFRQSLYPYTPFSEHAVNGL